MNRYNLSKRLTKVVNLVEPAAFLVDIGCDHGFLSIDLVSKGKVEKALCTDINEGPLLRAKEHIAEYNLQDKISTLLSDGLTQLVNNAEAEKDFDAAAICGMGGIMGIKIMYEAEDIFKKMKYIYLQLQSDLELVRIFLKENGYDILFEDMVFEDGKYYTVLKISPRDLCEKTEGDFDSLPAKLKSIYDSMSVEESLIFKYPYYVGMDDKVYKDFLEFMIKKYRNIYSYLPDDSDRKEFIQKEYDIMENAYRLFMERSVPK